MDDLDNDDDDDGEVCGNCGGEGGYAVCGECSCPCEGGEDACDDPMCWRRCDHCGGGQG